MKARKQDRRIWSNFEMAVNLPIIWAAVSRERDKVETRSRCSQPPSWRNAVWTSLLLLWIKGLSCCQCVCPCTTAHLKRSKNTHNTWTKISNLSAPHHCLPGRMAIALGVPPEWAAGHILRNALFTFECGFFIQKFLAL